MACPANAITYYFSGFLQFGFGQILVVSSKPVLPAQLECTQLLQWVQSFNRSVDSSFPQMMHVALGITPLLSLVRVTWIPTSAPDLSFTSAPLIIRGMDLPYRLLQPIFV